METVFLEVCTNEFMGKHKSLLIPNSEVKVSVKSRDFYLERVLTPCDMSGGCSELHFPGVFKGFLLMTNHMDIPSKMQDVKGNSCSKKLMI